MTKRLIQLELVARHTRGFARDASRLNSLAVATARAQHERHHRRLPSKPGRIGS